MSTYVIGDVHGCYIELQELLSLIKYNPNKDDIWFLGDLVNRGPASLEVLLLVKSLPRARVVLGNHDLFMLAHIYAAIPEKYPQDFIEIINSPHRLELADWLCTQTVAHYDASSGVLLVHAGIAPQWGLEEVLACAQELEAVLAGHNRVEFFKHMLGDSPNCWDDKLAGWSRLRCITNILTRLRFCTASGVMDFQLTGLPGTQPKAFHPWYTLLPPGDFQVVFGHWASLQGQVSAEQVIALDGGCVWGGELMGIRLEDRQIFRVKSQQSHKF